LVWRESSHCWAARARLQRKRVELVVARYLHAMKSPAAGRILLRLHKIDPGGRRRRRPHDVQEREKGRVAGRKGKCPSRELPPTALLFFFPQKQVSGLMTADLPSGGVQLNVPLLDTCRIVMISYFGRKRPFFFGCSIQDPGTSG
jgi:hypothetical protein